MPSLTVDFLDNHRSTVASAIAATISSVATTVAATVWVKPAEGRTQGAQAQNGQCQLTAEFGDHLEDGWSVFDFI